MQRTIYLAMVIALSGCAWQTPYQSQDSRDSTSASPAPKISRAKRIVANDSAAIAASIAHEQIGIDYVYGGESPAGFDCSGLVNWSYAQVGVSVPRTTRGLWDFAQSVPISTMQAGDVLFFNIGGKPSHVGLYLGDRYFVHAPSTGKTVTTQSLDNSYYRSRLLRVGRLVRD